MAALASRAAPTGGELFIVDNSETHWKGLRYLQEWTEIARAFDIATGYFEIGALLALDGHWQKLERIRILLGDEVTARTRQAILDGLRRQVVSKLDASLEAEKETNDFLRGVAAIVEGMRAGRIECRVYSKRKFHAKTYITHPRLAVVGSVALVGSSNFTLPGLTQNIELNIQIRAAGDVAQLQAWFERHWEEAEPITEDVIRVIERHTRDYTPFEVYARALQELLRTRQASASEWEKESSVLFPRLDEYQRSGYAQLLDKARAYGGALLCDGVGLGKTFVGLMLIERLIAYERKRVVLLVPKSGRGPVWETALRRYLPSLFSRDFSSLAILNHTDLLRTGEDFPERLAQLARSADAVVVDEAHHFRNRGREGESRHWKLRDLCAGKTLFLLTATPVNNSLLDLQHLIELFARQPDHFRAAPLGIHSLAGHFRKMERDLAREIAGGGRLAGEVRPDSLETNEAEAGELLQKDALCGALVVQRSRAYVKRSQAVAAEGAAASPLLFPRREPPQVMDYSIQKTYGRLLELVEKAFAKKNPLFSLAIYYPLAYPAAPAKEGEVDPLEEGRQEQIVRLIRILFLKRFESSARAFEFSCEQLLRKLLAWVTKHSQTPAELKKLDWWTRLHSDALNYAKERQLDLFGSVSAADEDEEEDLVPPEILEAVEEIPRGQYRVGDMIEETFRDLDTLVQFLAELKRFEPRHDDKLRALVKLLKGERLKGRKVLLFTEYAATARYLRQQLENAKLDGLDEVDSLVKRDRAVIIRQFAPYYNGTDTAGLAAAGLAETRILISTDVLSEGLNLQDATFLINYDLHWNPVRLMQRIGRVDRRLNAGVEAQIVRDHPDRAKLRGAVAYWNFLPPDELDGLLKLYKRVSDKTLRISKVFGIEGKKLLKPDDDYDDLRDFDAAYDGAATLTLSERLRLEWQALLKNDSGLGERLTVLPGRLFSGKRHPQPGTRAVFFCYALPAPVLIAGVPRSDESGGAQWSEAAGESRWLLYRVAEGDILDTPADIHAAIRCAPDEPRRCVEEAATLREVRLKVEKHLKQTYLKQTVAPIGVRPVLKCWMELN